MTGILAEPFFQRALLAGLAIASVAGPVGCFIVWRRMAYFGETLAHSGLFGVGLGLLLGFSLTLGAAASAVAVALLLVLLRNQRALATDTLLGILSHGSLALGIFTVGLVTTAARIWPIMACPSPSSQTRGQRAPPFAIWFHAPVSPQPSSSTTVLLS